jgi:long-subunit acyl-CoA synthetase (AMP-forming)
VVVGGDGGGPVPGTGATGLAVAAAGGIVTGFGRPGTLGGPLPGASVAIDDDGAVLVRAASTAPGAPGLRDDGWLPTGLSGTLDDGHLVVAEVAPPDPS